MPIAAVCEMLAYSRGDVRPCLCRLANAAHRPCGNRHVPASCRTQYRYCADALASGLGRFLQWRRMRILVFVDGCRHRHVIDGRPTQVIEAGRIAQARCRLQLICIRLQRVVDSPLQLAYTTLVDIDSVILLAESHDQGTPTYSRPMIAMLMIFDTS